MPAPFRAPGADLRDHGLVRAAAIVATSGIVARVIVGGIGGRLVTRFAAIAAGAGARGAITESGNVVRQITLDGTLDGTIELFMFAGIAPGVLGPGVLLLLRAWLPATW